MAHRFVARSSLGNFRGSGAHVRGSSGDGPSGAGAYSSGCAHVLHRDGDRSSGAAHAPVAPWHHRPGKRARSLEGFPTIAEDDALRRRSLLVSKTITTFARYPERHPAGVVPAGDGSLDVDQLWVCWGRRCGFSRTQLLQHMADHAISDNGRRRFLLHSDHDGRTLVSVAAHLRRMPRRHRRGTRRRSSPQRAVDKPLFCLSHVSISSEDDFVDDADNHGLHEEDPADPESASEEAVSGDLERDVKLEQVVKTEEAPADDCSLAPTLLDAGSQTCKDELQDFTEDAMPSAQVFTQSVPSLSPVSTVDSRSLSPPPGQTLYSVTPTVSCMRESDLSVDILTRDPGTSLGVTSHDSFSPGFSISTPEAPASSPSPYSVSPTIPNVLSIHIPKAAPSPFVVPVPPSPPSPPTSSFAVSPSRHEVDDNASLSWTGGYIPPRAHILVRVAKYESFLASRSVLVHEPHTVPPVPTPSPRPLSGTPLRPSPPLLPSCWNPQSPLHPPAPVSSSPATVGAVWAKPPATRTHYPRQAPRDSLHSDTPTPSFSSCPLPSDLPFPSVLVPAPSPPHSCPLPATSLPADSPSISPHPCYHHDTHSTSGPGRSRSPFTPLRPKKRAASTSSHVAHGTVLGSVVCRGSFSARRFSAPTVAGPF